MVEITRRQESWILFFFILGSLMALGLVVNYSILPSLPHEEQLELRLYTDTRILTRTTTNNIPVGHPTPQWTTEAPPLCWLSIELLIDQHAGVEKMFTSFIDLPLGQPTDPNVTVACARGDAFIDRHPLDSSIPVYIEVTNRNNVFFNESTGSSIDYSHTYDSSAVPPGLVIYRTVGEGIKVGGGFLLTLCIVCFVLPVSLLGLRYWEDSHPGQTDAEIEEQRRRETMPFSSLQDSAAIEEDDIEHHHRPQQLHPDDVDVEIEMEKSINQRESPFDLRDDGEVMEPIEPSQTRD